MAKPRTCTKLAVIETTDAGDKVRLIFPEDYVERAARAAAHIIETTGHPAEVKVLTNQPV